jgi:hypothetical protein
MTDGLRPAPRGRLGAPVHKQEMVTPSRTVTARIDGAWVPAVVIAQRQTREGGPWEICLEYTPRPGSNHLGWFITAPDDLRADDGDPPAGS